MALPINIQDLLKKKKVESNRIEFKASWNTDKIYILYALLRPTLKILEADIFSWELKVNETNKVKVTAWNKTT